MTYIAWVLNVQFAPGFHPLEPPDEGDWVSLGKPLRHNYETGQQDDLGEFQAGSASFTLDNATEELDHLLAGSPVEDALPFTPVRLVASRGLEVRVKWSGYTLDGFSPEGIRLSRVVLKCTDWMGWANTLPSPDCSWAAWVQRVAPSVWMRALTQRASQNTTTGANRLAYNSAAIFRGAGGDMKADGGFPGLSASRFDNQAQLIMGAPNRHFGMGDSGTNGGLIMDAGDALPSTGQWLACAHFRTPNVSSLWWGGSDWYVQLDGSGYLYAFITVGGVGVATTLAIDHTDDVNHMWFLKVQSTGGSRFMHLYSDMGGSLVSPMGAAGTSGGGQLNFHGIGYTNAETGDFAYFDDTGNLPDVWGIANQDGLAANSWSGSVANNILWASESIQARLPHLFQAAAVPAPPYQVLAEANDMYVYDPSGTLASEVRLLGSSWLGAAYCLRDGTVRVRDSTFTSEHLPDFDQIKAKISDDPAATAPTATITDAFTRANNADLGGDWQYDSDIGNLGIISNTAYVSAASSLAPTIRYQRFAYNCTVEVDLTNEVNGQGIVVRYDNPTGAVASGGRFITISKSTSTVNVFTWIANTATLLGTTGADALGTTLTVTVDEATLTVQIDGGTVHSFTITTPEHMTGDGVGISYSNIGVLPANTARWDNFSADDGDGTLLRVTNRSRTPPRADRVINIIEMDTASNGDIYYQDADSIRRYGPRPKTFVSNADNTTAASLLALEALVSDVLAARKDPTIEIGEITLKPWDNQELTDWVMRHLELEIPVTYREALYRTGTQVLNGTYRIAHISETWANAVDWTVTVKLVPA